MSRANAPIFAVLALIAACGGKVLTDSGGGNDPGGGQGGSGNVTGTTSGTTSTAGAVSSGTGFGTAGDVGAGGSVTPCGPTLCGPGTICCNPQCGICAAIGGGCPDIACGAGGGFGTAGSSGVAGSFGIAGSLGMGGCGTPDACQARIPPVPFCPAETACLCKACMCQANQCLADPGCQQIWQCALKLNCRGANCYTPQTCKGVIDQYGVGSTSMNLALQVDQCDTASGCDSFCGAAVDAGGVACSVPPPPFGAPSCTGQVSPDQCYQQCTDSQMNTYVAKCSGTSCTCFYDGQLTCSCYNGAGGLGGQCGGCCPQFPR